MEIQRFADMGEFGRIMSNWAVATGLACVAVGTDKKSITESYNFTDFCGKYTRKSREGSARCEKCIREGQGVYQCHAGLLGFKIELAVNGEKAGYVTGGQVLTNEPDEEEYRKLARTLGINEEEYIEALHNVKVCPEESVRAAAELLGMVLNLYLDAEYSKTQKQNIIENLGEGVRETNELVEKIRKETGTLKSIQSRQKILALNASIEAARAGEKGAGFAVVASEVGKLSERSSVVNKNIEEIVSRIYEVVSSLQTDEENLGK